MNNYTGKIYFYKNYKYNLYMANMAHPDGSPIDLTDCIVVGETEVNVDLRGDTREEEIEILEEAVEQQKIEHQVWLDTMSGKIQSLRAIEAPK